MTKPDYERGNVKLWNRDCLEWLPTLEAGSVDAVVTDPPYEAMKGNTLINHAGGVARRETPTRTVGAELGSSEGLVHCQRVASKGAIAFCSYHWIERCVELLGGSRRALVSWYKRNSPYSVNNSPWYQTEYAWAVQYRPGIDWRGLKTHFDFPMLQGGCMASERVVVRGKSVHPTQKPVELMKALLLPGMDSIGDPYMGLGTTGVACVQTGRTFWGVEKEARYFDLACRRIDAAFDSLALIEPTPPAVRQATLFTEADQ